MLWLLYNVTTFSLLQLLRKRHIGNDIVTVVFQEPGSLPFDITSVRSHFQHVFIIVKVHDPNTDHTSYRSVSVYSQSSTRTTPATGLCLSVYSQSLTWNWSSSSIGMEKITGYGSVWNPPEFMQSPSHCTKQNPRSIG